MSWDITTSCYPYSDDTLLYDGSDLYACSIGCERCECEIARVDADADGEKDATRYYCADCGQRLARADVMDTCTRNTLTAALARSMFRGMA